MTTSGRVGVRQSPSADRQIDNDAIPDGAATVYRQRIRVGGEALDDLAEVVTSEPTAGAAGLVVRVAGSPALPLDAATETSLTAGLAAVVASLSAVSAQLTAIAAELAEKTEPADEQTVAGTITADQGAAGATPWPTTIADPVAVSSLPAVEQGTSPWVVSGSVTTGGLTDAQLRAAAVDVALASVPLPAGAATETTLAEVRDALGGTLGADVTDRAAREVGRVRDRYTGGEALADQAGGDVRTFAFASPVQLVWVRVDGDDGRADPFGGTPSATAGIYCEDGTPNPITVQTSEVRVYAASGAATIHVWGFRE